MADHTPIDIIQSRDENPEIRRFSTGPRRNDDQPPQPREEGECEKIPASSVPPDGGYGWVCVACIATINGHTWGINSTYGVFLSHYLSHDVFHNTSYLEYAFIGGLSMSCALLVAPLATHLIHLYGTRPVLNLGVVLHTLSLIGASFATLKWHLFLSQGLCFGLGLGFLFVGSVGITPQWFLHKRSVANGITAAGSGLGGLTYSLAAGSLIPRVGLPWTFRILGIICFCVNLICSNLLRDRNKEVGSRHKAFHLPLMKLPQFLLFQAWGVLSIFGYVILLFSIANFALSVGLTATQGSTISALLNLGQALGRPLVGVASDRFGRLNVSTFLTFICGVFSLVIWIFARSMGVLCFFAILIGTVAGTLWATAAPVCAEVIGLKDLPSGLSLMWLVLVIPGTIAEPIALLLRDESNKDNIYLNAQLLTGFTYIGGAICLWIVRGWKVGDRERMQREEEAAASAAANNSTMVESHPAVGDEKEESGPGHVAAAMESRDSSQPEQLEPLQLVESKVWSPASLTRRMVVWKWV
ncbi:hypothetical protein FQN54_002073 [Arachnomyces sp. PD_36]|nr:hypothetical protein FQN54_002073 [Arachnomyces sp. PD_36]